MPPACSRPENGQDERGNLRADIKGRYNDAAMRMDWTRPEVAAIYHPPLLDLLMQAHAVRASFIPQMKCRCAGCSLLRPMAVLSEPESRFAGVSTAEARKRNPERKRGSPQLPRPRQRVIGSFASLRISAAGLGRPLTASASTPRLSA